MRLRERFGRWASGSGRGAVVAWAIAPLLCVVVPGLGAVLAFVWIVLLFVLGRESPRSLGWRRLGGRDVAIAIVAMVAIQALSQFGLEPLVQWATQRPLDLSALSDLPGNPRRLIVLLVLSWIVGAFLEETVFRGFIIGQGLRLFGPRHRWSLVAFSSILFGVSHLYQGVAGVLLTGIVGFIFAAIYLGSRRNLGLGMLVHGLVDTVSIVELYLGVQSV